MLSVEEEFVRYVEIMSSKMRFTLPMNALRRTI